MLCARNHTPPIVLIHIRLLPNVMKSPSMALSLALYPAWPQSLNAAAAISSVIIIIIRLFGVSVPNISTNGSITTLGNGGKET